MAYITKAEREYEKAYDEGCKAFRDGISTMENPYRHNPKRNGWHNGWKSAQWHSDMIGSFDDDNT